MKKLLLTLLAFLILTVPCFGAGTTTAVSHIVKNGSPGNYITITATADASAATFLPILFSPYTNSGAYTNIMLGRWLTSARTTPGGFSSAGLFQPAPTANYDVYLYEKTSTDDFLISTPTLAIGSTTTHVSNIALYVIINGVSYSISAVAAGTAPGDDVIVATKYGAVAFDVGANGTIDAIEATDQVAQEFTSAAAAVAALPACASDHVRLGHVTATKSDGAFTFGTTALSAANSTVAYTSTIPAYDLFGGRLANRSATASEEVYAGNTDGDNQYVFIKKPVILVITGNSVNSAVTVIDLNFN